MKAARQASAKSMVNAETVLSFTPRTGLVSSCATSACGIGVARVRSFCLLRRFLLACGILTSVVKSELHLRRMPGARA
jgi:hypothetical protein